MYLDLKIRIKFMLISMKYSNKSKIKNIMLNDLAFNLKKSTNCQLFNVTITNLNKFIQRRMERETNKDDNIRKQ